eukprot:1569766-Rhodomonas_salina.2
MMIPGQFRLLERLEVLDVSYNCLEGLPINELKLMLVCTSPPFLPRLVGECDTILARSTTTSTTIPTAVGNKQLTTGTPASRAPRERTTTPPLAPREAQREETTSTERDKNTTLMMRRDDGAGGA